MAAGQCRSPADGPLSGPCRTASTAGLADRAVRVADTLASRQQRRTRGRQHRGVDVDLQSGARLGATGARACPLAQRTLVADLWATSTSRSKWSETARRREGVPHVPPEGHPHRTRDVRIDSLPKPDLDGPVMLSGRTGVYVHSFKCWAVRRPRISRDMRPRRRAYAWDARACSDLEPGHGQGIGGSRIGLVLREQHRVGVA